jgi:hypothetical protein
MAAVRGRATCARMAQPLSRGATFAAFAVTALACSVYDLSLLPLTGGGGSNGGGDANAGSAGDERPESGGGGDESGAADSGQGAAGSGGTVADTGLPENGEGDAPVGQGPVDANRPDSTDGSRVPDARSDVVIPNDSGPLDSTFALGGYGDNGAWRGYAFASAFGTTATITPMCDPTGAQPCFLTAGRQLCVRGNVGIDPATASGALLGWNLNQPMGSQVRGTVVTGGPGLTVRIAGGIMNGLRVQIEDTVNKWCAPLPPGGGTIPWASFNTTCWTPTTGANYVAGTPIQDVAVIVPSTVSMAVPFDFCLVTVQ